MKLPSEWEMKTLGELGTCHIGLTYKPDNVVSEGGTLVLRSSNIQQSRLVFDDNVFVNMDVPSKLKVCYGDILICVRNGSRSLIGKSAVIEQEHAIENLTFGAFMSVYRTDHHDYVRHLFHSDMYYRQIRNNLGATINQITNKNLNNFTFPFPKSSEERNKIAEILSTVDKKIDLIDQKIAETEKLKTGLMQKLFSEGVGVQDENGDWQPHSEFKESMYGSIPLCWEVSTFKKLLESKDVLGIQDGNHGESHPVSSDFVSEGVPFITANKISSRNKLLTKSAKKISHEQYKSLRIGFSKPGDVILTHKGTVGLTAIVSEEDGELMMSPQTTYYRLGKNSCLINSFLYYFFQSPGFKKVLNQKSQQSTRAYIGITKQAELSILIPEPKEQKQISSILNAVDSKLDLLTEQKIEVKKLKKGLMQKLLTGEWRVPVEETEAA
ncbi:restriction endonuclease subunit S [Vibrio fluvialis]|nr:restriction endonuclease subunit S [Vibrio fluvialis]